MKKLGIYNNPKGKTFLERISHDISSLRATGKKYMLEIKAMGSSDCEKACLKVNIRIISIIVIIIVIISSVIIVVIICQYFICS